ncbi:hypothetical protein D3C85_653110 [compost metagenome]
MLDLDVRHLDTPGVGLCIQYLLNVDVQPFALGQQFVQLMFTQHGAQRGLRQLAGGHEKALDLDDRLLRVEHAEVQHRVDLHRDVVTGDHVLRRHIQHHGAQIDPHHLLHHRNQQDQPRALDLPEAPELEHHRAFVFAQDAKGR